MSTQTPNYGLVKPAENETADINVINSNMDVIDQQLAAKVANAGSVPSIQAGPDASKPAPGTAGRLYVATDTQIIYRDTGTAWAKMGAVKWGDIDGKPSSFTPSAHKSTHATGGTDVLTPADIGAAAASDFNSHLADYVRQIPYAVASGSANSYAVTLSPAPGSYTEGLAIAVKINVDNTGPSTLNVNGLGAKAIKKPNGADVSAGNLKAGSVYTVRYNGSNFILQGEYGGGNAQPADVLSGKTFTNDLGQQTGTMPDRGAVVITPTTVIQTIARGYHNGSGYVKGDASLIPSNIRAGKSIFGVSGSLVAGPDLRNQTPRGLPFYLSIAAQTQTTVLSVSGAGYLRTIELKAVGGIHQVIVTIDGKTISLDGFSRGSDTAFIEAPILTGLFRFNSSLTVSINNSSAASQVFYGFIMYSLDSGATPNGIDFGALNWQYAYPSTVTVPAQTTQTLLTIAGPGWLAQMVNGQYEECGFGLYLDGNKIIDENRTTTGVIIPGWTLSGPIFFANSLEVKTYNSDSGSHPSPRFWVLYALE